MGRNDCNINNRNQHAFAAFTTIAAHTADFINCAGLDPSIRGESIAATSSADISRAIICFQYVERIKSELIIAAKLVDRLNELEGDELKGAAKMYAFFLEALQGEINIAYNVLEMKDFETARGKVEEATNKADSNQYEETIRLISEAISHIASSGQWAMQTLKNGGFL